MYLSAVLRLLQFDREAESSGLEQSVSDKAVLLFNQALIHMRVGHSAKVTNRSVEFDILFPVNLSSTRTHRLLEFWSNWFKSPMHLVSSSFCVTLWRRLQPLRDLSPPHLPSVTLHPSLQVSLSPQRVVFS